MCEIICDIYESLQGMTCIVYCRLQFGLGVDPNDEDSRVAIMVWNTCAFTIQSIGKLLGLNFFCYIFCLVIMK